MFSLGCSRWSRQHIYLEIPIVESHVLHGVQQRVQLILQAQRPQAVLPVGRERESRPLEMKETELVMNDIFQ